MSDLLFGLLFFAIVAPLPWIATWLRNWYRESERKVRARCRQQDMEILWPALCDLQDVEHARFAFGLHAHNDPAWTMDYTEQEIYVIIQSLPVPK